MISKNKFCCCLWSGKGIKSLQKKVEKYKVQHILLFFSNFFVLFPLFQWWSFLPALLSRENPGGWSFLCGLGMRRISCRPWVRCHGNGEIHSSKRIWPGYGKQNWWIHGRTRNQIHQRVCADQGRLEVVLQLIVIHLS